MPRRRIMVIGVGNAYRGDDAAGLIVAERLQAGGGFPGVTIQAQDGDGTRLLESMEDADAVILIDAFESGALPGTIHHIALHDRPVSVAFLPCSSHMFGLAEAIELARVLQRLPVSAVLYGIEGKTFELGAELSMPVRRAIPNVMVRIRQEIAVLSGLGS